MSSNHFPNLTQDNHSVTSPATPEYNCIAWAAEDDSTWWEPDSNYYWPQGITREYSLQAYMRAYESIGHSECENGDFEEGFTKIAIYVNARGIPTHASRQLPDGHWTSKLGQNIDISHDTTDALAGPPYGRVAKFMKRSV